MRNKIFKENYMDVRNLSKSYKGILKFKCPDVEKTRPGNLVDATPPIQALGGDRRKRGLSE